MPCFPLKCQTRPPEHSTTAFSVQELERATCCFAESSLLGKGSYGSVYKATLECGRLVAVKRPLSLDNHHGTSNHSSREMSGKELEILSQVSCSHVVNLLGCCRTTGGEVWLVVEFMKNGTLHDALHTVNDRRSLVNWRMRARFLLQVAKAISALHSARPQIIHRDIKSSNVLLDANWNARLGDFGLALRGDVGDIMCTPAGTLGYFDPLYDQPEQVSTKIDVFSFGVLILETLSGRLVIDTQRKPAYMVHWALPLIKQNKPLAICDPRLRLPNKTRGLKMMAFIAARCIRLCPSKRPTMTEVVRDLTIVNTSLSWRRRNISRITKAISV